MDKEARKICNTCGGNGEIGYFQGESRFFITREECPACYGVGSVLDEESGAPSEQKAEKKEEDL